MAEPVGELFFGQLTSGHITPSKLIALVENLILLG